MTFVWIGLCIYELPGPTLCSASLMRSYFSAFDSGRRGSRFTLTVVWGSSRPLRDAIYIGKWKMTFAFELDRGSPGLEMLQWLRRGSFVMGMMSVVCEKVGIVMGS